MPVPPDCASDSQQIFEALAHGVAGDDTTALAMIEPIARRSDAAMYALLCSLAESASFDARQQLAPGELLGIEVKNIHTGAAASINVLPPGVRFAAQFVNVWANRDEDTAHALYVSLYRTSPEELGVGLRAVYDMAIISLRALVERKPKDGAR